MPMGSTTNLINKIFLSLSDISHPLEGTFYLFLIAVFVRWRWPNIWNNFLKRISADDVKHLDENEKL